MSLLLSLFGKKYFIKLILINLDNCGKKNPIDALKNYLGSI